MALSVLAVPYPNYEVVAVLVEISYHASFISPSV